MYSKKFLMSLTTASILLSPVAQAINGVNEALPTETVAPMTIEEMKEKASLSLAQEEALNLLVYTTLMTSEVGAIAEIPESIKSKYNTAAKVFFSSPSIIGGGVGVVWMGAESFEKLESVFAPITALFRVMANAVTASGELSSEVIEKLIPEWVFESSEKSFDAVASIVQAILKPLFTKGVGYSLGFSSLGLGVSASSFVALNSTGEAMTYDQVRSLLGYDKDLQAKINETTSQLSDIFSLSPEKESKFKEDLMNAIIEEGINNDFDTSKMNVDTFKVLKYQLSPAERKVATTLGVLYKATENKSSAAEAASLSDQVIKLLGMSAVLETMLETKELTRKQRAEISLRLVNTQDVIKQIQRTMR
jgi:hypothetical protein